MNVYCATWTVHFAFCYECALCKHGCALCMAHYNHDCALFQPWLHIVQPWQYIVQPRLYILYWATITVNFTTKNVHYALYRCLWTVLPDCTVHCALYSPLCIMQPWQYSVHCTVHQCIMQPLLSIMQPWLCILHPWQWLNFIKLWPTNL